jgi:uncharacterized glyoxalase superfamily protein PhnB
MSDQEERAGEKPAVTLQGVTLQVSDVEQALAFYTRIPGAEVAYHRAGEYAIVMIGKGQLGLVNRRIASTHLEIDADDPDAVYVQLKAAGLPVTTPPKAEDWGDYTFVIYDTDGNCLEFSRPRPVNAGAW